MNLNGNWDIHVDSKVYKALDRIPKRDARAVFMAIESLAENPYQGDVQKLKGEPNLWRRRVGSYRFFYELYPEKRLVRVTYLERRTSKTY